MKNNRKQILNEESNAYSLFVYAIRSQLTRDYYLRRLRIFFNHINLEPEIIQLKKDVNCFADKATNDPTWAFNSIIRFLQFQKDRVEKEGLLEQHLEISLRQ